jgi:hypothetical protein
VVVVVVVVVVVGVFVVVWVVDVGVGVGVDVVVLAPPVLGPLPRLGCARFATHSSGISQRLKPPM